jgi:transcriptional regulator
MYVPEAFATADPTAIADLIGAYGFATLVTSGEDGLVATHVPVLYAPSRGKQGILEAHIARANPHGRALDGGSVLAIFTGPHAYVSPSWYENHPSVPTWNYAAVHVYGRARLINDAVQLRGIVSRLVDKYESGRPAPWSMAGLTDRYMSGMLNAIVGIEIDIERIEAKHKLSQNRKVEDRRGVIKALSASDEAADRDLAQYMLRHVVVE